MKKKILALCLCIILGATTIVFGTMAYFTDSAYAGVSSIVVGNVRIEWVDESEKEIDSIALLENSAVMIPGQTIVTPLAVKNVGDNPCYLRVNVIFSSEAMANLFTVNLGGGEVAPVAKTIQNEECWVCTYELPAAVVSEGKWVDNDFSLQMKSEVDADDLAAVGDISITFLAEAIQTTGFADGSAAFDAYDDTPTN